MYTPVGSISAFNKVPRFGRTSDITEIYVNDSIDTSTVVDYIRGTLFVAGFLIAVCLLWLVLLICCKCLGRRAGIYAGFPPKPDSMANLSENRQSRPKKATILIIVCAILITFSGITFFVRGAISLERLLWNVEDSATELQQIEQLIVDTADDAINAGTNVEPLRDRLVDILQGGICTTQDPFLEETTEEINKWVQEVLDAVTILSDFSRNELQLIRGTVLGAFKPFNDALLDISEAGENVVNPLVLYSSAALILLGTILTIGSYLALRGKRYSTYFCLQTWFILPLFFLLIISVCVIAAVSSSLLTVNSDMCLGGQKRNPEEIVKILVEKAKLEGIALEATFHYVINSCQGEFSALTNLDQLIVHLQDGATIVKDFQSYIELEKENLPQICENGGESLDMIQTTSGVVSDALSRFELIAKDVRGILECQRINDIYIGLHHNLLCENLPNSLSWIFTTMLLAFVLGLVSFLMRGALLPSEHMDGMYEGVYSDESIVRVNNTAADDLSYEKDDYSYGDGSVSYEGRADAKSSKY